MELKKLNLIVATALNRGIGFQGTIPWRLKYVNYTFILYTVLFETNQ